MSESFANPRLARDYETIAARKDAEGCVFCRLKDKYIVHELSHVVLTVNIFPYIDGQLMVIPRTHKESILELTDEEVLTIHALTVMGINVLRDNMGIEGLWMVFREGARGVTSGKTVRHVHQNIMPYKEGLNTWHYQEITIPPEEMATKLRYFLGNERA